MNKLFIWIGICLFLGPLYSCAPKPVVRYYYPNKPDLVVYEYCSADAYGAKLSKETIGAISRFNAFSNLQGSSIEKIYIIREFKITTTQILESYAMVQVRYDFLATLQLNGQIPLDPRVNTLPSYVDFLVVLENGLWKIKNGSIPPSIYKDPALKYLNSLADKGTPEEKEKIELLIQQLEILN